VSRSLQLLHSVLAICCFFFSSRRRHTRCYRDWSSDVCSSDLRQRFSSVCNGRAHQIRAGLADLLRNLVENLMPFARRKASPAIQIGRASCRERVESTGGGVQVKRKETLSVNQM